MSAALARRLRTALALLHPVDDGARTLVTITEKSWKLTEGGAHGAFGNCMGWTGMLSALKVWSEHGINLREGYYK